MNDLDYIHEALIEARKAWEIGEVPVGCVIVKNDFILARAHNAREFKQDPCSHAEIEAIRIAARALNSWRLNDCVLYVTLEPCIMCMGAILQSRISKVCFGAKDPKGGAISLGYPIHNNESLNHRFEVVHIPTAECGQILTDFFKKLRN
jgi:tRNA(adenine34) deaminase